MQKLAERRPARFTGEDVDRLRRIRRGGQVELQWSSDLNRVWREIRELSPDGYRFTVLQEGPPRWRMQVTRRRAAA